MHLLHMTIYLYCIFPCKKEFFCLSSSYNFLLSVFISRLDDGLKTEPKLVAKVTECIYIVLIELLCFIIGKKD